MVKYLVLIWSVLTLLSGNAFADAQIYVVRESDGTVRFTNRTPPKGAQAKIFTAKNTGFSWYRVGRLERLQPNVFKKIIADVATEYKVDAGLLAAVIHVESAFNPKAVSKKGARGLMQLMPGTANQLGVKNSFSPEANIRGGANHLKRLIAKYDGNLEFALAAYNAGEGAVEKFNGVPPYAETQDYVKRVLRLKSRYSNATHG